MGVLEQVLKPIGEVVGDLAVCSELFDNKGVRANGGEEVLGYGGGIYVPVVMRDLSIPHSPEQEAGYLSLWGGVKPGSLGCRRSRHQGAQRSCGTALQAISRLVYQ